MLLYGFASHLVSLESKSEVAVNLIVKDKIKLWGRPSLVTDEPLVDILGHHSKAEDVGALDEEVKFNLKLDWVVQYICRTWNEEPHDFHRPEIESSQDSC